MRAAKTGRERRRRPGIPTGHAGEYFVMGELLRRGFDAQLADRNTEGYDLLVGRPGDPALRKVQVKTTRATGNWFVQQRAFATPWLDQVTIYVIIGETDARKPVRYFLARNRALKKHLRVPKGWSLNGYVPFTAVRQYEDAWATLIDGTTEATP